jgi:hypothetical protein
MENKENNKAAETAIQEIPAGDRGIVGTATPALTMKQRWHEATHVLMNVGDKHNPRKQAWVRKAGTPSLKQFARQLLKSKDALAIKWFADKRGACNQKRTDANLLRASLERQATRVAKRKRDKGGEKSKIKAPVMPGTIIGK